MPEDRIQNNASDYLEPKKKTVSTSREHVEKTKHVYLTLQDLAASTYTISIISSTFKNHIYFFFLCVALSCSTSLLHFMLLFDLFSLSSYFNLNFLSVILTLFLSIPPLLVLTLLSLSLNFNLFLSLNHIFNSPFF